MEHLEIERKRVLGGLVLAGIIVILFLIANLPWAYVESHGQWDGTVEISGSRTLAEVQIPTMAGWPFRYLIRSEIDGASELRYWSSAKLIGNGIIALAAASGVFLFGRIRDRVLRRRPNRFWTKPLFDTALALIIIIVPAAIVGNARRQAIEHQKIAAEILRTGNCFTSIWLPKPLANRVPAGMLPWLKRVRQVQVISTNDAFVERICEIPTLVQIDSFRGPENAAALSPLADRHYLNAIGLVWQNITPEKINLIRRLPWVSSLTLAHTDLSAEQFRRLDSLTQLRTVDLTHTDLKLSEIGKPAWSANLKQILLTRPAAGESDELVIDDWPNLEVLSVVRESTQRNSSPLAIRLSNLPKLRTLQMDRIQKHKLFARNLRSLAVIHDDFSPDPYLLDRSYWIPGLGWYEQIELENLPSLVKVASFSRHLTKFRIRNLPNLRELEIGARLATHVLEDGSDVPVNSAERCQEWVDEIGQFDGPSSVTFSGLIMNETDFSKLAKNQGIRKLSLPDVKLTFDQAQRLGAMRRIRNLNIGNCVIEADQLSWFLDHFPELESLRVDGSKLNNLELVKGHRLRLLQVNTLNEIDSIRILDQPELTSYLRADRTPAQLEIRNARGMRGLAFSQPWPKSAVVTGLRDLHWFAAGGEEVKDPLLKVLLACPNLDQLILGYPSISRSGLCRIGELQRLTVLQIPGANVDDSITATWRGLESLWEINLDDNPVGAQTIAWLSTLPSLRSVSLNRVELDDTARQCLAELGQVSGLRLSGVQLRANDLSRLLSNDALELLDLSHTNVSPEILELAANSPSLKVLILHGCNYDPEPIERLLETNSNIAIDLGELTDEVSPGVTLADTLQTQFAPEILDDIKGRMEIFHKKVRFSETSLVRSQSSFVLTEIGTTVTSPNPANPNPANPSSAGKNADNGVRMKTHESGIGSKDVLDSKNGLDSDSRDAVAENSDHFNREARTLASTLDSGRINLDALRTMIDWKPKPAGSKTVE
ncbi:MAG: hypothetical protein WBD31_21040 [Rubripirellula sp.]